MDIDIDTPGDEQEYLLAGTSPTPPTSITDLEIDVREDPFQLSSIVDKIDKKKLVTKPEFQRANVWKTAQKSEFIESILLNYPLPPLFLNQEISGRYIVVDGLQRTSSIYDYIKGVFPLQGLNTLNWLNGKRFAELEPALQSRIEDRKLTCYVLKPSVPLKAVYDIFARINRGGTQLTRQEIRHALYQGQSTRLLENLVKSEPYHSWIGASINALRMRDREAALRCVAFARINPEKDYNLDMDAFLENAMKSLNTLVPLEREAIEIGFTHAFASIRSILGEDSFRLKGGAKRQPINRAVMETVFRFFIDRDPVPSPKNIATLQKNYAQLLLDVEYNDAVKIATGDRKRVQTRFRRANTLLGSGLDSGT